MQKSKTTLIGEKRILCVIGVHYFKPFHQRTRACGLKNHFWVVSGKKCVCCGKEDFGRLPKRPELEEVKS